MRKTDFQYGYERGQADARIAAFLASTLTPREIELLAAQARAISEPNAVMLGAATFRRLMNTIEALPAK